MSETSQRFFRRFVLTGLAFLCPFTGAATAVAESSQRCLVELFTSQGCSSCPPADALVGRLSADSSVLVLSYHITYWDDLGWKDPFSSSVSTDRQYAYAQALQERSVFTPQLLVNGTQSLVGSEESAVRRAVVVASQKTFPVKVSLSRQPDGSFDAVLEGPEVRGDVWEARYVRHSVTSVHAGENRGRSLETFNNVTHLERIGQFKAGRLKLQPLKQPEDGLAVFVQSPGAGPILGAAAVSIALTPGPITLRSLSD
jgi:hypothetical protein